MRIIGIDPGLRKAGWGIIELRGSSLKFIGCGLIRTRSEDEMARRLNTIDAELFKIIETYTPNSAAIEETFVNTNPRSALKLGMARGVAINAVSRNGLDVAEYSARVVKKAVAGTGTAQKAQVSMMVKRLLPQSGFQSEDEADALAVCICHAHYCGSNNKISVVGA